MACFGQFATKPRYPDRESEARQAGRRAPLLGPARFSKRRGRTLRWRRGVRGSRPVPGRLRTQADHPRRARDARADGDAGALRRVEAAGRAPGSRASLHMTVQTAVLIETLVELGAEVRWASCNIFSTQDEAAAAVVVGRDGTPDDPRGVPVFAWKGETLPGVLGVHRAHPHLGGRPAQHDPGRRRRRDPDGPQGCRVREGGRGAGRRRRPTPHEYAVVLAQLRGSTLDWVALADSIQGVTEETTTGVHRLYEMARAQALLFPAINVNDSVTKSKFDNKYGIRHSLIDGINRGTDVLIGGKVAARLRLRRRRQGLRRGAGRARAPASSSPRSIRSARCRRRWTATRWPAWTTSSAPSDIFVTATGCVNVITADQMSRMKHLAIVGNIGHFDNEIDMAGLERSPGVERTDHQAAGRPVDVPRRPLDRHDAQRGTPAQPRQRHRSPELRDEQLASPTRCWPRSSCSPSPRSTRPASTPCPRTWTKRSPGCIWTPSASALTTLTTEQADYLGVPVEGPYKADLYRY